MQIDIKKEGGVPNIKFLSQEQKSPSLNLKSSVRKNIQMINDCQFKFLFYFYDNT